MLHSGLPDSYEILVTGLDARPDDKFTLEYVSGKLVEEYKRKTESLSSTRLQSALKIYDKGNNSRKNVSNYNNNKQRETRDCFFCKKKWYLKIDGRA